MQSYVVVRCAAGGSASSHLGGGGRSPNHSAPLLAALPSFNTEFSSDKRIYSIYTTEYGHSTCRYLLRTSVGVIKSTGIIVKSHAPGWWPFCTRRRYVGGNLSPL